MRFMAMVETGGPLPTAMDPRDRSSRGTPTVTDGPFIETKELIGGATTSDGKGRSSAGPRRRARFSKHRTARLEAGRRWVA